LSTQKYKNTTGWIYEYLSKQTGHLSKELLKIKNKNSLDFVCSYVYLLTVVPGSNKTKYKTNIKLVRFQTAQGVLDTCTTVYEKKFVSD